MGCRQSKSTLTADDTTASRTLESLPDNEKKALTTAWKQIRKDPRRHSTIIFVRLFRKHPVYRRYFQDEPGVPMTALAGDERVQKHCVSFNNAMGDIVRALTTTNGPDLAGLLQRLAHVHKDMPLARIDFDNFSVVFLDYLRAEPSVQLNDMDLKVWDHVMNLLSQDVCDRMEFIKRDGSVQSVVSIRKHAPSERRLGIACLRGSDESLGTHSGTYAMRKPDSPIVLPMPVNTSMRTVDSQLDIPGRNIDDYSVPMPKGFTDKRHSRKPKKTVSFDKHMQVYPPYEFKEGTDRKLSARARRRRWTAMCGSVYDNGVLPPRVYEEVSRYDESSVKPAFRRTSATGASITSELAVNPSSTLALTPKDKKLVTDLWTLMRRDARASGVKVFITMFEMFPETLQKFPKLVGRSTSELRVDKPMQSHAEMVMKALSALIDNLNEPSLVLEMLRSLGESHKEIRIYKDDFLKMKTVMVVVAKETLGQEWNKTYETAWRKAIDAIYSVLFQYLGGPEPTYKE